MIFNKRKASPKSSEKRKAFSLVEISVAILIIGILIAGISQASDMIDEGALKGARSASKGSRVSRVKDLVLWLDATADGTSLSSADKQTIEGESVVKWKDSNPNSISGFTFTGVAPKYDANKTSGLPGIYFNTTSASYLKLSSKFDNSVVDYTIYLVYQPVKLPASETLVIMEKRSAAGVSFPYKLEITSTGLYKFSDSTASIYGAKKASTGKVNLIRLTRSSSGSLAIVVDDASATVLGGTTVNSDELIIGVQNAPSISSGYIDGRIGELVIFERDLSASEKNDIEKYLYKKWKIEKDSTKVVGCVVTTANAGVATIAVGAGITVPCASGYTGSVVASCSAAPNFTYSASGTCALGCIIPSSVFTTSSTIAAGATAGANCKNGNAARTISCPVGGGTPTYTACP